MDPEAIATGFVAGYDLGVVGEAEACLGGLDLGQEHIQGAGRDGSESWLLSRSDRESQFPGVPAQLQGEVEHRGRRERRILVVGRRHGKAPAKWLWIQLELNRSDSRFELTSPQFIVSDPR